MKINKYLIATSLAGAFVLFLNTNSSTVQAATIQIPTQGTSYVRKGNTYKLHLKEAGRVTVNTNAKIRIYNSIDWEAIPYSTDKKNTKEYYLRSGNYKVVAKNPGSRKIRISYTKLTKHRKQLDDYPIYRTTNSYTYSPEISLGQEVKGFSDMFSSYKNSTYHSYTLKVDKSQKLTMGMNSMPVYYNGHRTIITMQSKNGFSYYLPSSMFNGRQDNKKITWYVAKGEYKLNIQTRGLFNFKITGENTDQVPVKNEVTKLTPVKDGLQVDFTKSEGATEYVIYINSGSGYIPAAVPRIKASESLSTVIPSKSLVNGKTYQVAVLPINRANGFDINGELSDAKTIDYHAVTDNKNVPDKIPVDISYYDDNGSDEPYIDIKWPVNKNISSYEVQYRLKGQSEWQSFLSSSSNGDEITSSSDKNSICYFEKGKTYEIRVRGLNSNIVGPWSDIKTVTVNVTPAGN